MEPNSTHGAILCLINQKGGCGKSSSCFHLAGSFATQGKSVLLIDVDPQGSLSQGCFGSSVVEQLAADQTLAAVFQNGTWPDVSALVTPTEIDNVAIICANHTLANSNHCQLENSGMMQFVFSELLAALPAFDVVLLDCPPNLYLCSWAAMLAADFALIPVPPEDFGTQGLRAVHQAVDNARQLNPRLKLLGHVVTRCDARLTIHRHYEQKLREIYGCLVLDTVIPEASAFKVALACRQPVSHFSPRTKAAVQCYALSVEIDARIAGHALQQRVA